MMKRKILYSTIQTIYGFQFTYPSVASQRLLIPNSENCFPLDKFHLMRNLGKLVESFSSQFYKQKSVIVAFFSRWHHKIKTNIFLDSHSRTGFLTLSSSLYDKLLQLNFLKDIGGALIIAVVQENFVGKLRSFTSLKQSTL